MEPTLAREPTSAMEPASATKTDTDTETTETESAGPIDADFEEIVADLTGDDLRGLLRDMVIVRRLDEEATALQRQGELGLWASLRGQEAAQVGSGRALQPADMAFPSYREHGVAWCRGIDIADVLSLFRGVDHGGWDPTAHNFALYSIVVGSQALHATGYAMGVTRDGGTGATIVYFGDGASSEGDVNEAFGWASVFGAPLVFFCQNNQWAISEPSLRQSRIPIYLRARGFGFPSVRVDGNDVLATLAVTRWALAAARSGAGPVLVEAVTYRMAAHTTADDPTRYRPPGELSEWARRDPVERMRTYLLAEDVIDEAWFDALGREADELAATLRRRCLAMPDPRPVELFDHVFVEETDLLRGQRDALATLAADEPGGAGGNDGAAFGEGGGGVDIDVDIDVGGVGGVGVGPRVERAAPLPRPAATHRAVPGSSRARLPAVEPDTEAILAGRATADEGERRAPGETRPTEEAL
jgi:pyruvate dehydrogenase E1 component alpha subunit